MNNPEKLFNGLLNNAIPFIDFPPEDLEPGNDSVDERTSASFQTPASPPAAVPASLPTESHGGHIEASEQKPSIPIYTPYKRRACDRPLFATKSPHFFKLILEDSIQDGRLEIPATFVHKHFSDSTGIASSVVLEVPSGEKWEVELSKSNGKTWLQHGWKEFAEHYSLKDGYLVVFRYEGDREFHIIIFDATSIEIEYPRLCTEGDDSSIQILSKPSSCCKRTRTSCCKRTRTSSEQCNRPYKVRKNYSTQETEVDSNSGMTNDSPDTMVNEKMGSQKGPTTGSLEQLMGERSQGSKSRHRPSVHGSATQQERQFIRPFGVGFDPPKAKRWITISIKRAYDGGTNAAYETWNHAVREGAVDRWWAEFKKHCTWDESDTIKIWDIFNQLGKRHLTHLYCAIRNKPARKQRERLCHYMSKESFAQLENYFASKAFLEKSNAMKVVRNKAGDNAMIYRGGAKSVSDLRIEMRNKDPDGRDPNLFELFTHVNSRPDGTMYSSKAQNIVEKVNTQRQALETGFESNTQFDVEVAFIQAVGKKKRGKVSGLGSEHVRIPPARHSTGYLPSQSSANMIKMQEEIAELKQRDEEKSKAVENMEKREAERMKAMRKIEKQQNKILQALLKKSKFEGSGSSS